MYLRIDLHGRDRRALENALPQTFNVFAIEGLALSHHFIQHGAQAEQIRPAVSGLTLHLFRRHVMQARRNAS